MSDAEAFDGCWYITETDTWDEGALNAIGPAYISFARRSGSLGMLAITAALDCRYQLNRVDFSFMGEDDGEPRAGRGWAEITAVETIEGMIYFHDGEETSFVAERSEGTPRRRLERRK